jgi:hypothetical protein
VEVDGMVVETSNVSNTNGTLPIGSDPFARPDVAFTAGVFNVGGTVDIVVVKGRIEESRTVAEAANTISCSLWVSCSTPETSDSVGMFKIVVAAIRETVSSTILGTVSTAEVDALLGN